ncbi:MAG: DUF3570 domain-containing protein [Gammaproteobacteria bacterium]
MGFRLPPSAFRQERRFAALLAAVALVALPAGAGVLPDDRADVLYHRYDGGGITIDGPSVLVRKKFGEKFSASANFYIDMVSSASIDVQLTASPYEEERTQYSASFDYLRGKSTYSIGFINSEESDYEANTTYYAISHDLFGDLTTITMSYKRAWDDVFRNVRQPGGGLERDPTFGDQLDRRGYGIGVTQVLTRNMILSANYEVLTDEGFLNNPYRSVRFVDPTVALGYSFESEIYPATRTSNAISARLKRFLPWRGAAEGSYRFFTDTWGIQAHTAELGYTHPAWNRWVFDGKVRYYRQDAADFYSDLFPRRDFANFLARDKELATFDSVTVGVGAAYQFTVPRLPWIQKSTANIRYDHLIISYDDFRDATKTDPLNGIPAGAEPLYELDADIVQLFLSIWF